MTDNERPDSIEATDPRLTDFVLGELSREESQEIENAIAKTPELATAVEEIRQMTTLLGEAYQAETSVSLLDEQKAEIAAAGRSKLASKVSPPVVTARRRWLPLTLAASLIGLMIGGTLYLLVSDSAEFMSANLMPTSEMASDKSVDRKMASSGALPAQESVEDSFNSNPGSKNSRAMMKLVSRRILRRIIRCLCEVIISQESWMSLLMSRTRQCLLPMRCPILQCPILQCLIRKRLWPKTW